MDGVIPLPGSTPWIATYGPSDTVRRVVRAAADHRFTEVGSRATHELSVRWTANGTSCICAENERFAVIFDGVIHNRSHLNGGIDAGARPPSNDAELLLWQIAERVEPFQELATAIVSTRMGGYLDLSYSFLSQTKRSIYEIRDLPGEDEERLIIQPTEARYLFVYPFIKTRPWYRTTLATRQGMAPVGA